MANVNLKDECTKIANKIRDALGSEEKIAPIQFTEKIDEITSYNYNQFYGTQEYTDEDIEQNIWYLKKQLNKRFNDDLLDYLVHTAYLLPKTYKNYELLKVYWQIFMGEVFYSEHIKNSDGNLIVTHSPIFGTGAGTNGPLYLYLFKLPEDKDGVDKVDIKKLLLPSPRLFHLSEEEFNALPAMAVSTRSQYYKTKETLVDASLVLPGKYLTILYTIPKCFSDFSLSEIEYNTFAFKKEREKFIPNPNSIGKDDQGKDTLEGMLLHCPRFYSEGASGLLIYFNPENTKADLSFCFGYNSKIEEIPKIYNNSNAYASCIKCYSLKYSNMIIGKNVTNLSYIYRDCENLKIAAPIMSLNISKADVAFLSCHSLQEIRFQPNSIDCEVDFSSCSKLSIASIESIAAAMRSGKTVTFSYESGLAYNKAKGNEITRTDLASRTQTDKRDLLLELIPAGVTLSYM